MPGSHAAPSPILDTPLEVGPEDWAYNDFYHLVTAMVIPRPVGWISTIAPDLSASALRRTTCPIENLGSKRAPTIVQRFAETVWGF